MEGNLSRSHVQLQTDAALHLCEWWHLIWLFRDNVSALREKCRKASERFSCIRAARRYSITSEASVPQSEHCQCSEPVIGQLWPAAEIYVDLKRMGERRASFLLRVRVHVQTHKSGTSLPGHHPCPLCYSIVCQLTDGMFKFQHLAMEEEWCQPASLPRGERK